MQWEPGLIAQLTKKHHGLMKTSSIVVETAIHVKVDQSRNKRLSI